MSSAVARPCPICSRPGQAETRPFCSTRCRDVDLQRWFAGAYDIPGSGIEDEEAGEAGQDRSPLL